MDLSVSLSLAAQAAQIAFIITVVVGLTKGALAKVIAPDIQNDITRLVDVVLGVGLALLFGAGLGELHTMRDYLATGMFGFGIGAAVAGIVAGIKALPTIQLSAFSPSSSAPSARPPVSPPPQASV